MRSILICIAQLMMLTSAALSNTESHQMETCVAVDVSKIHDAVSGAVAADFCSVGDKDFHVEKYYFPARRKGDICSRKMHSFGRGADGARFGTFIETQMKVSDESCSDSGGAGYVSTLDLSEATFDLAFKRLTMSIQERIPSEFHRCGNKAADLKIMRISRSSNISGKPLIVGEVYSSCIARSIGDLIFIEKSKEDLEFYSFSPF